MDEVRKLHEIDVYEGKVYIMSWIVSLTKFIYKS